MEKLKFYNLKLKNQLLILFTLVIVLISASLTLFEYFAKSDIYKESFDNHSIAVMSYIQFGLNHGFESGNYLLVNDILRWTEQDKRIRFITLTDANKNVICHHPDQPECSTPELEEMELVRSHSKEYVVMKDSLFAGNIKYYVFIGFDTETYRVKSAGMIKDISFFTLLILLIGTIGVFFITKSVTSSIEKLSSTADQIGAGSYSEKADENKGSLEVRKLAQSFNNMVEHILISKKEHIDEVEKYNIYLDEQNRTLSDANRKLEKEIEERKLVEEALRSSEENFRTIFNASPVPMVLSTLVDSKVISYNESLLYIAGLNKEDIEDKYLRDIYVDPSQRDMLSEMLIKNGFVQDMEIQLKHKKGYKVWGLASSSLINFNGEQCVISGLVDISDRKYAEESIRENQRLLQNVIDNAPLRITYLDNNYTYLLANKNYCEFHNRERDDIVGKKIFDIVNDREINNVIEKFENTLHKGKAYSFEFVTEASTGIRYFYGTMSPHFSESGEMLGMINIGYDITELKMAEIALKEAKEQAENANMAKSEFLANMSHEIRTPMNAILGFSQVLMDRLDDRQLKFYADAILNSGKNLLGLINDILDLSKIEAGRMELEYNNVNPYTIFKEIESIFSYKVNDKGIGFVLDIDQTLPSGLIIDEIRLRQILVNLVGNAVKFTEKGFIKLSVTKEQIIDDDSKMNLLFSVEDTGIGVAESQKSLIFDAFRQQSGQSTKKYGGTGLGLTITKRLVEMMGGSISLDSSEGVGTIFTVRLENVAVASTIPVSVQQPSKKSDTVFKNARILIVDDIAVNRQLIKEFLMDSELEFFEAENGIEAYEKAKYYKPDIILLDMKMPVMDGYATAEKLKNDLSTQNIPIIALTASAMKGDEERIRNIGCASYIAKPVAKHRLINEIATFIPQFVILKNSNNYSSEYMDNDNFSENDDSIVKIINDRDLVEKLNNEYSKHVNYLLNTLIIDEVEEFADELYILGMEYRCSTISEYSKNLQSYTANFDLNGIKRLLEKFQDILKDMSDNHNS